MNYRHFLLLLALAGAMATPQLSRATQEPSPPDASDS